ncbi:hypothetical protein [Streptomyces erythrochromogenes]|uniref:hypothetical protein n=1 Tax=Streptomyces erythrochromogenes TaxID=285574 RepID=UPI0036AB390A
MPAAVGVAVTGTGSDGATGGADEEGADADEEGEEEDEGGDAAFGSPPPPSAHPETPASRTTATATTHGPPR